MGVELVRRVVAETAANNHIIYEILGISREEYDELFTKRLDELKSILETGRIALTSVELLNWLGIDDDRIDLDNLIKMILIVKLLLRN